VWNRWRYTVWAPVYDRLVALVGFDQARARSIAGLGLHGGDRLLIVGAGTGLDLPHLPGDVAVTAIDVTPAMLERLQRRAAAMKRAIDAQVADARALPFPDESFDAVVLHLILAVMPEPARGLAEAARVLRRGRRIAVFDKFLAGSGPPPLARRAANLVARPLFSDINIRFEPLMAGTGLSVERDEPGGFGRFYRIITLRKDG
jgi:phosphatidylethanolamine/phosphatidyl-N-methylethanolamine N-methyltransferase